MLIKIFQAGQVEYIQDLMELHKLRTKVFKDRMQWDVKVTEDYFEYDQFDVPRTVYIGVYNRLHKIVGCCRLLPCNGPFMIGEIWPDYLKTITIPNRFESWELSRFAVLTNEKQSVETSRIVSLVTANLFYAVTVFCMRMKIEEIYAMHDHRIERIVKKIGCIPTKVSDSILIDGIPSRVGAYKTDHKMLYNFITHLGEKIPDIDILESLYENVTAQDWHQKNREVA